MTIDQELLLHKIETAEGEVTLDAYILREVIANFRDEIDTLEGLLNDTERLLARE